MSPLSWMSRPGTTNRSTAHTPVGVEPLERRALMSAAPLSVAAPGPLALGPALGRDEITLEAENATRVGPKFSRAYAGFTGTGYVDYMNSYDDYVEFNVNAPVAGTYVLGFRYAHGGATARNMALAVNGEDRPGGLSFIPSGSWATWQTAIVTLDLKAGANAVRLTAAGRNGPNLDSLSVRRLDPVPGPVQYQAEAPSVERFGAVVSKAHAGFTSNGYVDFVRAAGDFVEFTINAASEGTFALDFRYANGSSAARTVGLKVDGEEVPGGVTFGRTGSWSTWGTATRTVTLTQGLHQVRLTTTGQNGPNLDSLTTEGVAFPEVSATRARATTPQDAVLPPATTATFGDARIGGDADDQDEDVLA